MKNSPVYTYASKLARDVIVSLLDDLKEGPLYYHDLDGIICYLFGAKDLAERLGEEDAARLLLAVSCNIQELLSAIISIQDFDLKSKLELLLDIVREETGLNTKEGRS